MNYIVPCTRDLDFSVAAPPSKSYTHRAFIAGALASGDSVILHPLLADDTMLTLQALTRLGVPVTQSPDRVTINGCDGQLNAGKGTILDVGNSGTSLRLLTTLALLSREPVTLTGNARMQKRPIGHLADTLRTLGGEITFLQDDGYPPFTVSGNFAGGTATIDGSVSSQFISSILIAAPYAAREVDLVVSTPAASRSYLDITVGVMQAFGAQIKRQDYVQFQVSNTHRYQSRTYAIEGDYSSASYFFAMAAICGGRVTVTMLNPESVQGDRAFLEALSHMGCSVRYEKNSVSVERTTPLSGITVDMSAAPDTVQTLCMVAAMADTPTTITGISHLKYKESDRITSTAENLRRLGGDVTTGSDWITIRPSPLHGGTIDPLDDHRTAMSFAVLGLGIGGVTITDAECVTKSFPGFWEILTGVIG
ncbi:MAG: 3-phosphoshikimate 1-carboxyvinyltransferase [Methanoregula sp.]|nr:3-phosphoshikimate 1-carboxyvinyltransferase [Methanoregula sp.]